MCVCLPSSPKVNCAGELGFLSLLGQLFLKIFSSPPTTKLCKHQSKFAQTGLYSKTETFPASGNTGEKKNN
jgi:hypothetical protein